MKTKRVFKLLGAFLLSFLLPWLIFYLEKDKDYLGLALLPTLVLSLVLGAAGAFITFLLTR